MIKGNTMRDAKWHKKHLARKTRRKAIRGAHLAQTTVVNGMRLHQAPMSARAKFKTTPEQREQAKANLYRLTWFQWLYKWLWVIPKVTIGRRVASISFAK